MNIYPEFQRTADWGGTWTDVDTLVVRQRIARVLGERAADGALETIRSDKEYTVNGVTYRLNPHRRD